MNNIKAIGFDYSNKNNRTEKTESIENNEVATEERQTTCSQPHKDLIETINNLAGIITAKNFSTQFSDEQRVSFTNQLINSIALETELRVKTEILCQG